MYSIVSQAGGHVSFHSELGVGTTFDIYLPAHEEGAAASISAGEKSEADEEMPRGTETIMVVEDDQSIRDLVRGVLFNLGYAVLTASDGKEALKKIVENKRRIDILLTDVVLPGRNGMEIAMAMRKEISGLKVLLMSGFADGSLNGTDLEKNSLNFISKPFTASALAVKIRQVLDSK